MSARSVCCVSAIASLPLYCASGEASLMPGLLPSAYTEMVEMKR